MGTKGLEWGLKEDRLLRSLDAFLPKHFEICCTPVCACWLMPEKSCSQQRMHLNSPVRGGPLRAQ